MEGGKIKCECCPQQLSVTSKSKTIRCSNCLATNFVPKHRPYLNPDRCPLTSSERCRKSCLLRGLVAKAKSKLLSSGSVRPPAESLNYVACPPKVGTTSGARCTKRALLCGVRYKKGRNMLKGTFNDVKSIRLLLIEIFNFPMESIRVLTEEEPDQKFKPTKKNIQQGLEWLVEDCQSGDSLVFYFSGHGLRQPDFNEDELDGFDETICPVDFKEEGMILDNDINSTIVRPLKPGVKLHAIVDACHSGTILDLSYVYEKKNEKWTNNNPPSGVNKQTSGGLAISFSACEDHQMAADTRPLFGNETAEMGGAMTSGFRKAIRNNPSITYGQLLNCMHEAIERGNKAGCSILNRVFRNQIYQDPLLSSSKEFDIYKEKFAL